MMDEKIMSGCALSGIFDRRGRRFSGEEIVESMAVMHERSNGKGGGFAAYGIYPEHVQEYAFHVFYDTPGAREGVERYLHEHFHVSVMESIPTRDGARIEDPPLIWRYFVDPLAEELEETGLVEREFVVQAVMKINDSFQGAYVFSSGKNMGVFKGVGYPEELAEFYRLDQYHGYLWTGHGRFPTNTPGWWGGAHPFTLLDWSIVHNGEISSYGANKRYLEMFGYKCTMKTDTEVITYMFDLLLRKHELPVELAVKAVAPPLWSQIERMPRGEQKLMTSLRSIYSSALLNGPFSIILGHRHGFIALNDRIKLRPLVVAEKGDRVLVASEEAAIRAVCPEPGEIRFPRGGQPVIELLEGVEQL